MLANTLAVIILLVAGRYYVLYKLSELMKAIERQQPPWPAERAKPAGDRK